MSLVKSKERTPYRSLIVAGGRAERFGSEKPKSLLFFNGRHLLTYVVQSIHANQCGPVVVLTDREDFLAETISSVRNFRETDVMLWPAASSTFVLAKQACCFMADKFLFAYGHAPRPNQHWANLLSKSGSLLVTRTTSSSKRFPILSPCGYLEPPYYLERTSIERSRANNWTDFIEGYNRAIVEIPLYGPGEFNLANEFVAYREYLGTFQVTL